MVMIFSDMGNRDQTTAFYCIYTDKKQRRLSSKVLNAINFLLDHNYVISSILTVWKEELQQHETQIGHYLDLRKLS